MSDFTLCSWSVSWKSDLVHCWLLSLSFSLSLSLSLSLSFLSLLDVSLFLPVPLSRQHIWQTGKSPAQHSLIWMSPLPLERMHRPSRDGWWKSARAQTPTCCDLNVRISPQKPQQGILKLSLDPCGQDWFCSCKFNQRPTKWLADKKEHASPVCSIIKSNKDKTSSSSSVQCSQCICVCTVLHYTSHYICIHSVFTAVLLSKTFLKCLDLISLAVWDPALISLEVPDPPLISLENRESGREEGEATVPGSVAI